MTLTDPFVAAVQRFRDRMLRCEWGATITCADDTSRCARDAVQIVVLHNGRAESAFRLCAQHLALVERETDPHQGGGSCT